MAELKTRATTASVAKFLAAITDEGRRKDGRKIAVMMEKITRAKPKMWGPSIVGFGEYKYTYADGRELDWPMVGFSPRKQAISIYLMGGLQHQAKWLKKLGKHKTGKGCLYVNRLADIDFEVLTAMVKASVAKMKARL